VLRRASAHGVGSSVHVVSDSCDYRWSDLFAVADLVVLGSSSGTDMLLDVLAAGRPVVAPADPATAELVVPAIVGLVYQPGDVSGMAESLLRLVTTPVLRRGMGGRARQVARRRRLESIARKQSDERKPI
jgi:glycosyltransferase involved in cell wall biosynthesis